jgi:hypothetical protein
MKNIRLVAKLGFSVLLIFVLTLFVRNWMVQNGQTAEAFRKGQLPQDVSGEYQGRVNFPTDWQGKEFDASASSGMNIFGEDKVIRAFPFKTYSGQGLQDSGIMVLKIDYDVPSNPWWVRLILDEAVEVSPGTLLGKIHVKLPIGSVAIGYFELKNPPTK